MFTTAPVPLAAAASDDYVVLSRRQWASVCLPHSDAVGSLEPTPSSVQGGASTHCLREPGRGLENREAPVRRPTALEMSGDADEGKVSDVQPGHTRDGAPGVAASSLQNDAVQPCQGAHVQLPKPTLEQRASLLAIPRSSSGRSGKGGKRRGKDGFVSKAFNPQAGRPSPLLSTPKQSIRVTMVRDFIAFTTSTSLPSYYATPFSINSFPGYLAYVQLFDEYKVHQIEVWLEPSIVMSPSVGSTTFYSAVDLDDANTPAAADDVSMRQGCCVSETGTGHYHKWKPFVANALYSGTFTSYGSEPAPWIDCASSGVQHYGIKTAVGAADGIARAYYMEVRMVVEFRGPAI